MMVKALAYLKEILSNYAETDQICMGIYQKLDERNYPSELSFVKDLSSDESNYLNELLPDEIEYANDEQDQLRASQLNEIFELLL